MYNNNNPRKREFSVVEGRLLDGLVSVRSKSPGKPGRGSIPASSPTTVCHWCCQTESRWMAHPWRICCLFFCFFSPPILKEWVGVWRQEAWVTQGNVWWISLPLGRCEKGRGRGQAQYDWLMPVVTGHQPRTPGHAPFSVDATRSSTPTPIQLLYLLGTLYVLMELGHCHSSHSI